jgi:hypothetical protein
MGQPKEPKPSKLFVSLIASGEDVFVRGTEDLRLAFGEIDFISDRFMFDFTDYYEKEMGAGLFRHFIAFKHLIPTGSLPDIKRATNELEQRHATPTGNRRINLDPGYLCLEHVILATTKGYTHRPYLRDGIYADLTLIYRDKSYHALEWTYPDYRQAEIILLFNQLRKQYVEDLKRGTRDLC